MTDSRYVRGRTDRSGCLIGHDEGTKRQEGVEDDIQISGQGDWVYGRGPQEEEGEDLERRIRIFYCLNLF